MNNKTLTSREVASIKRVAKNVGPLVAKKNKISDKIAELIAEAEYCDKMINLHEAGIKEVTNGFTSSDLLTKVVEDTGKFDKDGKPIKNIKYEPKEGVLVFNDETKLYEIHIEQAVELDEVPDYSFFDENENLK